MPLEFMKALVIFRNELKTQPRDPREADVEVLTNVAAVCCHWHRSIATYRENSTRQLKRQFKILPQLLKIVKVERSRLLAVNYAREMMFTFENNKTLSVFHGETLKLITTYNIKSISFVYEMVSCNDTMKLFLADLNGDIWVINISSINNMNVNKFAHHEGDVMAMSLTRRRLLVAPKHAKDKVYSLVVYDVVSGKRVQSVRLPTSMNPLHSIETAVNVFVVSHWGESRGVSEMNSEGHVTRAYNGLLQDPYYFLSDSLGRLLVIDAKWDVLLLSRDFKHERVLLDIQQLVEKQTTTTAAATTTQSTRSSSSSISAIPWRGMCYDKKTRRLFFVVNYKEKINDEIFILKC